MARHGITTTLDDDAASSFSFWVVREDKIGAWLGTRPTPAGMDDAGERSAAAAADEILDKNLLRSGNGSCDDAKICLNEEERLLFSEKVCEQMLQPGAPPQVHVERLPEGEEHSTSVGGVAPSSPAPLGQASDRVFFCRKDRVLCVRHHSHSRTLDTNFISAFLGDTSTGATQHHLISPEKFDVEIRRDRDRILVTFADGDGEEEMRKDYKKLRKRKEGAKSKHFFLDPHKKYNARAASFWRRPSFATTNHPTWKRETWTRNIELREWELCDPEEAGTARELEELLALEVLHQQRSADNGVVSRGPSSCLSSAEPAMFRLLFRPRERWFRLWLCSAIQNFRSNGWHHFLPSAALQTHFDRLKGKLSSHANEEAPDYNCTKNVQLTRGTCGTFASQDERALHDWKVTAIVRQECSDAYWLRSIVEKKLQKDPKQNWPQLARSLAGHARVAPFFYHPQHARALPLFLRSHHFLSPTGTRRFYYIKTVVVQVLPRSCLVGTTLGSGKLQKYAQICGVGFVNVLLIRNNDIEHQKMMNAPSAADEQGGARRTTDEEHLVQRNDSAAAHDRAPASSSQSEELDDEQSFREGPTSRHTFVMDTQKNTIVEKNAVLFLHVQASTVPGEDQPLQMFLAQLDLRRLRYRRLPMERFQIPYRLKLSPELGASSGAAAAVGGKNSRGESRSASRDEEDPSTCSSYTGKFHIIDPSYAHHDPSSRQMTLRTTATDDQSVALPHSHTIPFRQQLGVNLPGAFDFGDCASPAEDLPAHFLVQPTTTLRPGTSFVLTVMIPQNEHLLPEDEEYCESHDCRSRETELQKVLCNADILGRFLTRIEEN
ncbi:unnamed protein product [Amoebophrya sp. A120]|nr:unnamed protein product [Amoebophrya sp. A120]|eukprot:GSA120T00005876001.1